MGWWAGSGVGVVRPPVRYMNHVSGEAAAVLDLVGGGRRDKRQCVPALAAAVRAHSNAPDGESIATRVPSHILLASWASSAHIRTRRSPSPARRIGSANGRTWRSTGRRSRTSWA
eukprot:3957089-Prymnesium_polylepis.1